MMSRRAKQMIRSLVIACMMSVLVPAYMLVAYAANARISFSDPTVTVGEEVSVTMKFSSTSGDVLGNTDTMLSYDSTMLDYINETENASGGAGSIRVWSGAEGKTEVSTVLRFKALQAGTTKIEISTWEAYDNDGSMVTMDREGTSTVTISPLATSSTDATLKTLKISPGTLTPAFTPTVENYTTTVGLDTDRLAISAEVNNSGARVVIEGGAELQEGENTVVCRVTAEDGESTKNYTITVNKVEGGENITGGEGETANPADTANVLAELKGYENTISIIEPEEGVSLPEGFKESSVSIGDTRVTGWVWAAEESPQYCIFYAVNAAGEKGFYSYDLTERTVQRYFGATVSAGTVSEETYVQLAEDFNSLTEDFRIRRYILWGLIALTVILLIVIIVLLRGRRNGGEPPYEERRPEESRRKKPAGSASARKLSKEERYMLGEEDEYEEPDEPEKESDSIFAKADEVLGGGSALRASSSYRRSSEAAAAMPDDDDDFEVIDLDDDDF